MYFPPPEFVGHVPDELMAPLMSPTAYDVSFSYPRLEMTNGYKLNKRAQTKVMPLVDRAVDVGLLGRSSRSLIFIWNDCLYPGHAEPAPSWHADDYDLLVGCATEVGSEFLTGLMNPIKALANLSLKQIWGLTQRLDFNTFQEAVEEARPVFVRNEINGLGLEIKRTAHLDMYASGRNHVHRSPTNPLSRPLWRTHFLVAFGKE